jgi:hypothetical protein
MKYHASNEENNVQSSQIGPFKENNTTQVNVPTKVSVPAIITAYKTILHKE